MKSDVPTGNGADALATEQWAPRTAVESERDLAFDSEGDAETLDGELRRIAGELARRELALGQLTEAFWRADGWRRLGYATAAQYARERLGTSLSSLKAKRGLARCAERMPALAAALTGGGLGYEAGRLVATIATPETVEAWLERAAERTVRYLREEVDAAQMFGRLAPGWTASPPSAAIMQELADLESRIVSGAALRGSGEGQMSARPAELRTGFGRARCRAAARHSGRVTLRFRLTPDAKRYYRWLERLFERHRQARLSFLGYLCRAFIDTWRGALGGEVAYANVYARDRYRCRSPVCGQRGVTPHHLKFRSAGGDDSKENIASLCVWCHLQGIHGGKLQASAPASDIKWRIGRAGHTVVHGRRRVLAERV